MEYVYSAMLLHSAGQPINEENVKKVLTAAGVKTDAARVKALVASLEGVNIDEAIKSAAAIPVAAAPAAAAEASFRIHGRVPDFAGKSVRAIYQFAVCDNAAPQPGPQGDYDVILHAPRCAKQPFPEGGCIRVVGHGGGDAVKLRQFRPDIHKFPSEVGRMLDGASVIVGVGGPDPDSCQFAPALQILEQGMGILL